MFATDFYLNIFYSTSNEKERNTKREGERERFAMVMKVDNQMSKQNFLNIKQHI
jgi:hypothetical protein